MTGGWFSCAMRSVTLRRTGKYTEWKSVRSQVQLLPVRQVIEAGWTLARAVECFQELCGVHPAPVEHLFECPSAEVKLVLNPLRWEQRWRCVPLEFRR